MPSTTAQVFASTSSSTDTGSEIPIVDIDIIPQQKDNNHAKQIVEISPALEHNLEIDVHHLSVPTVDRDDTENPLYATLSSSSLLH